MWLIDTRINVAENKHQNGVGTSTVLRPDYMLPFCELLMIAAMWMKIYVSHGTKG